MKLILTEDVTHLGHMGDLVEVKPGYGRNYLLPHGLAIPATAGNQHRLEHERRGIEAKRRRFARDAQSLADRIGKLKLQFARAAGEDDKLFGSVTNQDIHEFLYNEGIEIDRKRIHLAEPIKSLGVFPVEIRLHPEVSRSVDVWVVKE